MGATESSEFNPPNWENPIDANFINVFVQYFGNQYTQNLNECQDFIWEIKDSLTHAQRMLENENNDPKLRQRLFESMGKQKKMAEDLVNDLIYFKENEPNDPFAEELIVENCTKLNSISKSIGYILNKYTNLGIIS